LLIDSVTGQGTCVHLYLPRDQSACATGHGEPATSATATLQPRMHRIMLVADQPALRLVLVEVLTELGYQVQAFESGHRALESLQKGPPPDLLITDVGLPGRLDGYQLAEACQDLVADAPVLLITGYETAERVHCARPGRRTELLHKPLDLNTLGERIERLLGIASHPR
jgi:CheY-like chemotaxis protein